LLKVVAPPPLPSCITSPRRQPGVVRQTEGGDLPLLMAFIAQFRGTTTANSGLLDRVADDVKVMT
jgi:hypothetical protein